MDHMIHIVSEVSMTNDHITEEPDMGKLIRPVLESNVTGNCAADFTQKPVLGKNMLHSHRGSRCATTA